MPKTFKPNVSGKPIAHPYKDLETVYARTKARGQGELGYITDANGDVIRKGDTVMSKDKWSGRITFIRLYDSGKVFVTLTDLDLEGESFGLEPGEDLELEANQVTLVKTPEPVISKLEKAGIYTHAEIEAYRKEHGGRSPGQVLDDQSEELLKKDPAIFDKYYTPQKGKIKTWNVWDAFEGGWNIIDFYKSLTPPHKMMATLEKERDHTTGVFVKDLWGHAPHGALYFVGGWGRGNLVRFGRGQDENDYRILYFLVGDDKHPYAIMQLDGSDELKMLDASLLDKHRPDHPHRKAVHTMTKPDKKKDKADHAQTEGSVG